ncbi:MAG TPA: hypothetical protein VHO67_16145 [Polyangia bacterium]|nr:hypothetical protein [Polyangia bacterium]
MVAGCGSSTTRSPDGGAHPTDGHLPDAADARRDGVAAIDARGSATDLAMRDARPDVSARDAQTDAGSVDARPDVAPRDAGMDVRRTDGGTGVDAASPASWFDIPYLIKLVPDPAAGLLYALTTNEVVVLDVAGKREVRRVALGAISTDLDLSPDGTLLVAAQDRSVRLAVIDKHSWTVTYVPVRADPQQVEAVNGNFAYYATLDQWTEVHQVDLSYGKTADIKLNLTMYEPDIEVSASGQRLYVGESGLSGCTIVDEDLTVAPARTGDKSNWDNGYGFPGPPRNVYLGPSETNLYYAGHQLDAKHLSRALGDLGRVFAEDAAATFAVSERGLIDVALRTLVAPFAKTVSAAALTTADTEVWLYEPEAGRLSFAKTADLLRGKSLGIRETAAAPLFTYSFSKIIADPVRPRLYGIDPAKSVLVSVDSATGLTVEAAVIEYGARDVAVDAAGKYIYIGHTGMAIEQIDAATLTLVKYIFAPRDTYQVVALSNGRIATIDPDQWTTATIIDSSTGAVVDSVYGSWEGALAATADGKTLFVGSSNPTDFVTRYDVSTGKLLSPVKGSSLPVASRGVVATPDGTSVYYAGSCLNGTNLSQLRYPQADKILSVSPNGHLATSATQVYRVSDGTMLTTIPSSCPVQAISPDSGTLYCYGSAVITPVSLAGLN